VTSWNLVVLFAYSLGMAIGQVLFKYAADHAKASPEKSLVDALIFDASFWFALVLYGGLTLLWVWILTRVPLSRAYPFVALAFVFTPALAALLFHERLGGWYFIGIGLLLAGVTIIATKASGIAAVVAVRDG
jgi:drug/metabolite transporter (DMT)-like permease